MTHNPSPPDQPTPPPADASPLVLLRAAIGGILMGLANLVPGISGGTMLLASGIYPRFLQAIAELTRLRFRSASLLVLGVVIAAAAAAILTLAGAMGRFVIEHTWAAYSIFIGLTLGGVPVVWKLIGRPTAATWIGAIVGFAAMAALAYAQSAGLGQSSADASWTFLLLAGIAGAAAMILPGVSGGYLLLVLGVYVAILDAIDRFVQGLRAADMPAVMEVFMQVILPVGVGVVLGVVVASNVLKALLDRFTQATLGVLLGLLFGAVVGLWPFQQFVEPRPGTILKNQQVVTVDGELRYQQTGRPVKPKDWPAEFFTPTARQVGGAAGLVIAGFLCTAAIAFVGREKADSQQEVRP